MKINDCVYYHRYGEVVYVRDVDRQKDYLYNEIVGDILDGFRGNPQITPQELMEHLQSLYDLSDVDREEFETDILQFLEELCSNEILIPGSGSGGDDPVPVADRIARFCEENEILDSLCLELTYRCNERCIHCYLDHVHGEKPEPELTLEEYRRILDEAHSLGCFRVLITGGEVSVRQDFLDIAEYAAGKGMLVDLYTNGLSISEEQFRRICAMKPNSVSVSLYGGDAGIHDSITKVSGSFDRTLRFAMMLKCAGVDVFIKSVAMKQNASSMERLYQLGSMLRIPVSVSLVIGAKGNGDDPGKYRLNSVDEYRQLIALNDRYNGGVSGLTEADFVKNPDTPPCSIGRSGLSVGPFGSIDPCNACKVGLGNIRNVSLEEVWFRSRELRRIRELKMRDVSPKCKTCENISFCPVCIGFAELERDLPSFCEDVCLIAEAKRQYLNSRS